MKIYSKTLSKFVISRYKELINFPLDILLNTVFNSLKFLHLKLIFVSSWVPTMITVSSSNYRQYHIQNINREKNQLMSFYTQEQAIKYWYPRP